MKHTTEEAVRLATYLEPILAKVGYHCGITGSTLYKGGSNKDIDVIIYPHNPKNRLNDGQLQHVLIDAGFGFSPYCHDSKRYERCVWKGQSSNTNVDFFIF